MEIYIVTRGEYHGYEDIEGVFSTEEKAIEFAEDIIQKTHNPTAWLQENEDDLHGDIARWERSYDFIKIKSYNVI